MSKIYVRTELSVPGAEPMVHTAEVEEIDSKTARMVRLVQQTAEFAVTGAWVEGTPHGEVAVPGSTVPHPDTYSDYPDLKATRLDAKEFEALWAEAAAILPGLN